MSRLLTAAVMLLAATLSAHSQSAVPPDVLKDLAPTGKVRAAINFGNGVLAQKGADGTPQGVSADLSRELAKRLNVPLAFVTFEAAGKAFEAAAANKVDILFVAIEPVRAAEIEFSPPYVLIEGTYMVLKDSPLKEIGDVDRAGVRIAVSEKSAYDHFLSRTIKNATLVRGAGNSAGLGLLQAGQADVIAGVRQLLLMDQAKLPGSKVLEDRFMVIEQAMGLPKGRDAGLAYAKAFIEEMKASGFVARALEKSGVRGVPVAPPEKP